MRLGLFNLIVPKKSSNMLLPKKKSAHFSPRISTIFRISLKGDLSNQYLRLL
jgi:hypothetical protein